MKSFHLNMTSDSSGTSLTIATGAAAAIKTQAEESASELRAQGWQGDGTEYNIEAYPGDVEALEVKLGRGATQEERIDFERAVRDALS